MSILIDADSRIIAAQARSLKAAASAAQDHAAPFRVRYGAL
jgi:hypothetical protein